jgi:hypothetical protein
METAFGDASRIEAKGFAKWSEGRANPTPTAACGFRNWVLGVLPAG